MKELELLELTVLGGREARLEWRIRAGLHPSAAKISYENRVLTNLLRTDLDLGAQQNLYILPCSTPRISCGVSGANGLI